MKFAAPTVWNGQSCEHRELFYWLSEGARERLSACSSWPAVAEYRGLLLDDAAGPGSLAPQFCEQQLSALQRAGGYDAFIQTHHAVPSRPHNWHDFFNAMVWCSFPRSKSALSELQLLDSAAARVRGTRTARQSRATHFDESGVVLISSELELLELVRAMRWKELFWENRERFCKRAQYLVFGHGALEAMLCPYVGLMGKALLIHAPLPSQLNAHELDGMLAAQIKRGPPALAPLPLLGLPGLHRGAEDSRFFEIASYFRTQRQMGSKAQLPEIVALEQARTFL